MKNGKDMYGINDLLTSEGWLLEGRGFSNVNMVHAHGLPGVISYSPMTGEWIHEVKETRSERRSAGTGDFAVIELKEWLATLRRHSMKPSPARGDGL